MRAAVRRVRLTAKCLRGTKKAELTLLKQEIAVSTGMVHVKRGAIKDL